MTIIDGKQKLKPEMLKQVLDTAKDNVVMVYFTDKNRDEIAFECAVSEVIDKVFTPSISNELSDAMILTIANDDVALEILKIDIDWWSVQSKLTKLKNQVYNIAKPAKAVITTKTLAVGRFYDSSITNVEVNTFESNKSKEALAWLNSIIEKYYVRKEYDNLRVCMNYDSTMLDSNVWMSIQQLLEKGIAKS